MTAHRSRHERPLDREAIIDALAEYHVDYIMVGGQAGNLHGALTPTYDVDCLVRRTTENMQRLVAAMRHINARIRAEGLDDEDAKALPSMLDVRSFEMLETSTWRTDAGDLDIMTAIPTFDGGRRSYAESLVRATTVNVDGMKIIIASLDDIIESKEWANRPKDHRQLPELRRVAERQSNERSYDPTM